MVARQSVDNCTLADETIFWFFVSIEYEISYIQADKIPQRGGTDTTAVKYIIASLLPNLIMYTSERITLTTRAHVRTSPGVPTFERRGAIRREG